MTDPHVPEQSETAVSHPLPEPLPEERMKTWESTDLLGNEPEALILHRGQKYRLRCTKQGKLILYK